MDGITTMDYRVAVRAHGPQVPNRIHLVCASNPGDLAEVVNMNQTSRLRPVHTLEVHVADGAPQAVVRDAICSRLGATFILVHYNEARGTLWIIRGAGKFVWVLTVQFRGGNARREGADSALVPRYAWTGL